ncbi:putative signal peptide peptidase SppA [Lentibacillus sp. JNUCC-1]|uniref:signal peptide peptidase SppA n=1 Tax=Lentibacillus sp. JNUCC-1 TaxID=2654513 RepID=UPI00132999B3|nr:putative signal peptide peptidase SppA [Lentibacillus sp. JNUCC-1]
MMTGKRWIALGLAAFLLVVSVVFQMVASVFTTDLEALLNTNKKPFEEVTIESGASGNKIAVLELNGVIQDTGGGSVLNAASYQHDRFLKMIEAAGEDRQTDGLIIRVNSPGGGVVESAEIHDKIVDLKKKYDKPVYISMGNTAASGGYYISAPADKIVAHPATLTGSIGVIMESINVAELADEFGIDVNTIKSGEFKDIMSPTKKMTDKERQILQTMVDELYGEFVNVIVEGRDMDEQKVRELGDGRVYTGTQAKNNGLVDSLGNLEDTIEMMKDDHNLDDATIVEYKTGQNFSQLIGMTTSKLIGRDDEISGVLDLIRDSSGPRAMYLYAE